jgi:hypothetical protein
VSGPSRARCVASSKPFVEKTLTALRHRSAVALSWGPRFPWAVLFDLASTLSDLQVPRASPRGRPRSPSPDGEIGFTRPWSRSPPESSRPPGGPVVAHRIRLPRGSAPLRRRPPDEPRHAAIRPSRCGSARRFSQPLSGFLAGPGFAALSHAAAARGVLPSERCSSLGSRAPLGVACSLAVLHHRT